MARETPGERAEQNRARIARALDLLERSLVKHVTSGVRGAVGVRVPVNGDRIGDPKLIIETDQF